MIIGAPSRRTAALACFRADLEIGQDFERPHHCGMIPGLTATRRAGVEKFLRRCRVWQRDPERLRALQGKVEILLVKLDTETRIEGSLNHPVAVHLENLRGRKSAHESLADFGGIGASLGCENQSFGYGLDV